MASKSAERREPVTRGTGNVFADLGFPDAAERQAKLRLAYALNQVLEARKLSQADAAKVLGVTQPKVSALRHYKLAGFFSERPLNFLTAPAQEVEIVIARKTPSRKAGVRGCGTGSGVTRAATTASWAFPGPPGIARTYSAACMRMCRMSLRRCDSGGAVRPGTGLGSTWPDLMPSRILLIHSDRPWI